MRNHAAERDPSRNANFARRWADDPLRLPDFQHRCREVAPGTVKDVARRSIGRWLNRASRAHGTPAAEAFRQANAIRQKMGLGWDDLIEKRSAT